MSIPQLHTSRLLLRAVEPNDQQFIYEGLSHPEVIPYYGVRYTSFEETAAQMNWYENLHQTGTGASWIIVCKENEEKVGDISVYNHKPEHNKAEIGFWLLPQHWNKGYAVEAVETVIEYWKVERALHRMEAFVEEENSASRRLLERAGFTYEGTMRDCEWKNGAYISLRVYGLLLT